MRFAVPAPRPAEGVAIGDTLTSGGYSVADSGIFLKRGVGYRPSLRLGMLLARYPEFLLE